MIRPDLASLPAYVPGKRNPRALKLSSNEVAFGPLPSVQAAMEQVVSQANRYPDMAAMDIREQIAEHLGLTVDHVAVGCGSSALCQQLVQIACDRGEEVVFPWRSFEAYPIFAQVANATSVPVPLDDQHRLDLPAMAAAVTESTRLIFVCNPNNPSGTTITAAEFEEFMQAVPRDVIVALDEAYFEYMRAEDTPIGHMLIDAHPNLIALRTFSKAYGLAGMRIGYAFGAPNIIEALNKVAIPFGVNAVAQAAACASLAESEELLHRTDEVVEQRQRLQEELGAVPSEANFVWIPREDALEVASKLADKDVLVRAFPEGLRVTVTNPAEMDRFLAAWRELGL
ncbi:Putative phenylalanine aminotransferase [Corynebacterium ciconiae DSM 44920]|uniref:histidinol-phosphate transaminase n=1 Tax=Corynebacterium ciconiae TaxID=227319 RepID=UPI000476FB13|nr:histidinol-phosphate transaminase [Corynebacterium ciconiae]WKD60167.1 Putative phenylalanine aminotransferase [Corynebacterium ciconiae DSM 44920]